MKKIRAAVVGYGNIGQYALQALETAPDFEVAGIVRRNGAENKPAELAQYEVVKDIRELKDVDVAILATPTRSRPIPSVSSLPVGTRVPTLSCAPSCRVWLRRVSPTLTSVPACRWDTASASALRRV